MGLKKQAVIGVAWTFSQQFSVQIINFGVQIILARLLLPEMFGLIAMLTVFIAIGQTLMDSGMTSSLIRTNRPDQLDYSTVFMTNIIISSVVYVLVFFAAPFIADFYDQEVLKNILRVYALTFVIKSLVAVHVAKLTKEMNFKLQMKLQIPSTIVGAVVGVYMAYSGYGVWSLVYLNLSQTVVFTIQNWLFIKWRPSFIFNKRRFRYHFNFGYKMTIAGLIDTIYNNSYNIVIGKFFSPIYVGFYSQAETMRLFPVTQLASVMGKVTYPLFSSIKKDDQLKLAYQSSMKLVLFASIPVMLVLIIVANEFFLSLFGEKWLPSVPYFQVLAIASIVRPVSAYNLNILKVKGRSDLTLKVEIIKKSIGVLAIVIALPFGLMALVISLTAVSYLFFIINIWFCGNLINYPMKEQLGDIFRLLIIGFVIAVICYFFREYLITVVSSKFFVIALITLTFSALYLLAVWLFEKKMINILKQLITK
jgi:O-antigen/teichoic acid export membrane protein